MSLDEIYSKRWNELLFEGRNKLYGAYKLRKETGSRYFKALGCLGTMMFLAVSPLIVMMILFNMPEETYDPAEDIPRFEGVRVKEARPVRRPKRKSEPEQGEKNINIEDVDPIERMLTVNTDEEIDVSKIKDLPTDSIDILRKEEHLDLQTEDERTDGVIIDSIAHYPGGIASFMRWMDSTMVYPPACLRNGIQGTVTIAFIVESDGTTTGIRILKGAHAQLNQEALRVIHLMKPWRPAKKRNRTVRSQVTVPIVFEIIR